MAVLPCDDTTMDCLIEGDLVVGVSHATIKCPSSRYYYEYLVCLWLQKLQWYQLKTATVYERCCMTDVMAQMFLLEFFLFCFFY